LAAIVGWESRPAALRAGVNNRRDAPQGGFLTLRAAKIDGIYQIHIIETWNLFMTLRKIAPTGKSKVLG
jgi:hypothetical protein